MTLEWIAQQAQDRERAQQALEASNRRLEATGNILKRASVADNLEQALAPVVQEVAQVLGMEASLIRAPATNRPEAGLGRTTAGQGDFARPDSRGEAQYFCLAAH